MHGALSAKAVDHSAEAATGESIANRGKISMTMPRAVRHINETRALAALFQGIALSRADLARELGLTRSTASSIVAALIRDGLVVEGHDDYLDDRSKTGRPGMPLRLNSDHAVFLGADIEVGHETVVAIDLTAKVIARVTRKFDLARATPELVVESLVKLVRSVIAELPNPKAVRGMNVTVPGLLDHDGNILRAPLLRWSDVPILKMLRAKLPEITSIEAENDANAFAIAEQYRNGASAPSEALYILFDAGVGAGMVSNGKLLRGHDGYAGEIGHIVIGDEGFVALATLPGSLESFVGSEAVLARHRFHGGAARSIGEFVAALRAGSPSALETASDWSRYLGRGLATLTSILNPQKIVLGGAVAALFGFVEREVMASMRKHQLPSQPVPIVELSPLGADGPAIGAASILHRKMLALDEDLVFRGFRSGLE